MRTTNAILSVLLVFGTLLGCRDNEAIRPNWFIQGWGEVSALQNGTQWLNTGATAILTKELGSVKCADKRIGLVFFKFSQDGYQRQMLQFTGVIQRSAGHYDLTDRIVSDCNDSDISTFYATSQDDGDVGKSVYSMDTTAKSYLQVTEYDSVSRRIAGTFKVSFIKQAKYKNDDPSIVTFENGQFSTLVSDKGRFQ